MTFACRTFQGMGGGGGIVPFSASLSNASASPGVRTGTLTLNADGSGSHTVFGSGVGLAWYAPISSGIGSGVWVMFTPNTSVNSSITGSTGTVLSLASGASWAISNSNSTAEGTGTFTLTFYSNSAGTSVIGTQTGSWDIGYSP